MEDTDMRKFSKIKDFTESFIEIQIRNKCKISLTANNFLELKSRRKI